MGVEEEVETVIVLSVLTVVVIFVAVVAVAVADVEGIESKDLTHTPFFYQSDITVSETTVDPTPTQRIHQTYFYFYYHHHYYYYHNYYSSLLETPIFP